MSDADKAVEVVEKMANALVHLSSTNNFLEVLFASNVVRDGVVAIPPNADASKAFGPVAEKKRLDGFCLSVRFGGHGGIASKACATLAGKSCLKTFLATRVFRNDERDLIERNLVRDVEAKEANGVRTDFVLFDESDNQSFNLVVEQAGDNTILRGPQPREHSFEELASTAGKKLETAGVLGFLSLRSPALKGLVEAVKQGQASFSGLMMVDCTSGSDSKIEKQMLELLESARIGARSLIGLLSMNEVEAKRFAELLGWKERKVEEAALFVFERLRCPILLHTKNFSQIISHTSSRRIPSVEVKARRTVGAGDTLCGALALALAVRKRLLDVEAPIQLSVEECLLFSTASTCFRLEAEKKCFPTLSELTQFLQGKQFKFALPVLHEKKSVVEKL
ncbi:carbohydrate kinase family protein [Candidatus Micrarchaeota archaeon]|nr:carbohydrate kinase family protein [Candidatus Micrarchaeota archaeon]